MSFNIHDESDYNLLYFAWSNHKGPHEDSNMFKSFVLFLVLKGKKKNPQNQLKLKLTQFILSPEDRSKSFWLARSIEKKWKLQKVT